MFRPGLCSEPQPTPAPPSYDDVDDLGLPSLGDALLDKFPFCLPSDIGRIMDIFTAERVTPYWEVDLYETLGDKILSAVIRLLQLILRSMRSWAQYLDGLQLSVTACSCF